MHPTNHPLTAGRRQKFFFVGVSLLLFAVWRWNTSTVYKGLDKIVYIDAAAATLGYAASLFFLYYIVRYALSSQESQMQTGINYAALLVVFLCLNLGLQYAALYFCYEQTALWSPLLPFRITVSLMLFVASTLAYNLHAKTLRQKMEAEKAKIRQENTSENSQLVSPAKNSIQRISVKTGQKIAVVQIEDILYFEADKDYVLIFTPQGKHLKEMTMKYLEENLPSNLFLRIHRSFIVNVEAISRIELYEKQSYIVIMKNGARLKMTQTGYRLLREKLQLG